jgi:hypothetical protein
MISSSASSPAHLRNNGSSPHRSVRECFYAHQGRYIDKWDHYLEIYERYFARFVGTKVSVLEIGVSHGGSLQLWKEYFGPHALIWGIDIDPQCSEYANEPRIYSLTVNQADLCDLVSFREICGPFDIVIDDGSHIQAHQETSFKALWPDTRNVYLIEDCHSGFPNLHGFADIASVATYRQVLVLEKGTPELKRVIRGTPSRPLNHDEIAAQRLYSA